MAEFDWVTERANCSLRKAFTRLQMSAQVDIDTRNQIRQDANEPGEFKIAAAPNKFTVFREGHGQRGATLWSVEFTLAEPRLSVVSHDGTVTCYGTLTLNNNGECRIKVNDEELEEWQVRRKALETLFFPDEKPTTRVIARKEQ